MKPVEFAYYQLIKGKMYPAKIKDAQLVPSTKPLSEGVTNLRVQGRIKPQGVSKVDTVTPQFSIEEIED